jgi:hypothetical protein
VDYVTTEEHQKAEQFANQCMLEYVIIEGDEDQQWQHFYDVALMSFRRRQDDEDK